MGQRGIMILMVASMSHECRMCILICFVWQIINWSAIYFHFSTTLSPRLILIPHPLKFIDILLY
jgi:hypothetical protein